jgi:hypothetical protein
MVSELKELLRGGDIDFEIGIVRSCGTVYIVLVAEKTGRKYTFGRPVRLSCKDAVMEVDNVNCVKTKRGMLCVGQNYVVYMTRRRIVIKDRRTMELVGRVRV